MMDLQARKIKITGESRAEVLRKYQMILERLHEYGYRWSARPSISMESALNFFTPRASGINLFLDKNTIGYSLGYDEVDSFYDNHSFLELNVDSWTVGNPIPSQTEIFKIL